MRILRDNWTLYGSTYNLAYDRPEWHLFLGWGRLPSVAGGCVQRWKYELEVSWISLRDCFVWDQDVLGVERGRGVVVQPRIAWWSAWPISVWIRHNKPPPQERSVPLPRNSRDWDAMLSALSPRGSDWLDIHWRDLFPSVVTTTAATELPPSSGSVTARPPAHPPSTAAQAPIRPPEAAPAAPKRKGKPFVDYDPEMEAWQEEVKEFARTGRVAVPAARPRPRDHNPYFQNPVAPSGGAGGNGGTSGRGGAGGSGTITGVGVGTIIIDYAGSGGGGSAAVEQERRQRELNELERRRLRELQRYLDSLPEGVTAHREYLDDSIELRAITSLDGRALHEPVRIRISRNSRESNGDEVAIRRALEALQDARRQAPCVSPRATATEVETRRRAALESLQRYLEALELPNTPRWQRWQQEIFEHFARAEEEGRPPPRFTLARNRYRS